MDDSETKEKDKNTDLKKLMVSENETDVITTLERAKRDSRFNQEKNCIEELLAANDDYVRKTSIQMKWFEII
jgi:hypothetical protein